MEHKNLRGWMTAAVLIFLAYVWASCGGGKAAPQPPLPPTPSGATYVGSATCGNCHADIRGDQSGTVHAQALASLQQIGMGDNPECLECHTAGYGFNSGFRDANLTPHLAGVQCENCHGPGSAHVAGGGDKTKIATYPAILSPQVCGKCHQDAHHPTIEEFETAGHREVTELVAGYFADPNRGLALLGSCGPCHSGDYRVMVMENAMPTTSVDLRGKTRAEMTGVACAVCHDPHKQTGNNAELGRETQLRHKQFLDPGADPYGGGTPTDINVYTRINHACGQCHNRRGANPEDSGLDTSTSRAAHYSNQLDFLFGLGGVGGAAPALSEHRNTPEQCMTCHMYSKEYEGEESPAQTGHGFTVKLEACAPCHSIPDASARMLATKSDIEGRLAATRSRLNAWGLTANLDNKGALSWEYSSYGGPASSIQAQIPIEIKRARYNYYYVKRDGSFGVHNAKYARYLLQVANWELDSLGHP